MFVSDSLGFKAKQFFRSVFGYGPYQAVSSGMSQSDVLERLETQIRDGYLGENGERELGDLSDYEEILCAVKEGGFKTASLSRFREMEGERVCFIRHDVDIDLPTACRMAEVEAKLSIQSTFYFLHTAPYYGFFKNGVFCRHESVLPLYKECQDAGHEIGFHTDGYYVYLKEGRNGSEAILEELNWLRNSGLEICGTAAHNNSTVYGIDNFAVFTGRALTLLELVTRGEVQNGKKHLLPTGTLVEKELGLSYEANDVLEAFGGRMEYGFVGSRDQWLWRTCDYDWRKRTPFPVLVKADADEYSDRCILSHEETLKRIRECESPFLHLAVHPIYYGNR